MTDELTKTFFDKFGIEPKPYCCYHDCNCPINDIGKFNSKCPKQAVTKECDARIIKKPQITDSILLELLVIMTRYTDIIDGFNNVQELKEFVLEDLIYSLTQPECNIVKYQVRTLFEEG